MLGLSELVRNISISGPLMQGLLIFGLSMLWMYLRQWRQSTTKPVVAIAELWVYPIKSCAGIQLAAAQVGELWPMLPLPSSGASMCNDVARPCGIVRGLQE